MILLGYSTQTHDNNYDPIGLLDPNPQSKCLSLIQSIVCTQSPLKVLLACVIALLSAGVKAQSRCNAGLPSRVCTIFPFQLPPTMASEPLGRTSSSLRDPRARMSSLQVPPGCTSSLFLHSPMCTTSLRRINLVCILSLM